MGNIYWPNYKYVDQRLVYFEMLVLSCQSLHKALQSTDANKQEPLRNLHCSRWHLSVL